MDRLRPLLLDLALLMTRPPSFPLSPAWDSLSNGGKGLGVLYTEKSNNFHLTKITTKVHTIFSSASVNEQFISIINCIFIEMLKLTFLTPL